MKKAIALLEAIPDSSVYGEVADQAYVLLMDKTTAQAIHATEIPNADTLLRNLISVVTTMSTTNSTNVMKLIAAIPSVTSNTNYI